MVFNALKREKSFYIELSKFAWPIVLQNLLSTSAGLVDTFMVGGLGQDALAAVSLANTPFFVSMLMIFGLQSGGAVLISQYWGKRDTRTISRIIGTGWIAAVALNTVFSIVMFRFPVQAMGIFTNNETLLAISARYCKAAAFSQVFNAFTVIYIGALRSCESPRLGTLVMGVSVSVNIIFNYLLIYGKLGFPALGVEGAALATLLSRASEAAIVVLHILFFSKKNNPLPLYPRYLLRPGKMIIRDYIRYTGPVILNETFWSVGVSLYIVVYGHMAASGDIMAAHSLTANIERFATIIIFAIANCTGVFVGKAIGAGQSKSEVYALGKTFLVLVILLGLISGAMLIGALFFIVEPFIFPFMNFTEEARQICVYMTVVIGIIMACRAINIILVVGVFRGGGDVNFGLFLDTGGIYLWALPAAALAAFVFKLEIWWVFLFVISEEPIKMLIGYLRFKSGRWVGNVTREMGD